MSWYKKLGFKDEDILQAPSVEFEKYVLLNNKRVVECALVTCEVYPILYNPAFLDKHFANNHNITCNGGYLEGYHNLSQDLNTNGYVGEECFIVDNSYVKNGDIRATVNHSSFLLNGSIIDGNVKVINSVLDNFVYNNNLSSTIGIFNSKIKIKNNTQFQSCNLERFDKVKFYNIDFKGEFIDNSEFNKDIKETNSLEINSTTFYCDKCNLFNNIKIYNNDNTSEYSFINVDTITLNNVYLRNVDIKGKEFVIIDSKLGEINNNRLIDNTFSKPLRFINNSNRILSIEDVTLEPIKQFSSAVKISSIKDIDYYKEQFAIKKDQVVDFIRNKQENIINNLNDIFKDTNEYIKSKVGINNNRYLKQFYEKIQNNSINIQNSIKQNALNIEMKVFKSSTTLITKSIKLLKLGYDKINHQVHSLIEKANENDVLVKKIVDMDSVLKNSSPNDRKTIIGYIKEINKDKHLKTQEHIKQKTEQQIDVKQEVQKNKNNNLKL